MNALTIGSIALIAVLVFIYWLSRMFRRDGASQQEKRDREKIDKLIEKRVGRLYSGERVGSDALRVRKQKPWGENTTPGTTRRMERGNGNGRK